MYEVKVDFLLMFYNIFQGDLLEDNLYYDRYFYRLVL